MKQVRITYFDFLRGIAILMVVAIHTFQDTEINNCISGLGIFLRQIFNCAVPLFFAISGYFLAKKDMTTRSKRLIFWKHQIPKVYIPVLLWSLPYLVISLCQNNSPLVSIVTYFVCGYSIYYFIAVAVQYYICLPWLQKINVKLWGGVICIISILSVILSVILPAYLGCRLPLIIYAGHGDLWLAFFTLGVLLRKEQFHYSLNWVIVLSILTLALQMVEYNYLHSTLGIGIGIKPSSFLFSIFAILVLFHPKMIAKYSSRFSGCKILECIGTLSFGIYLIHCFFIIIASFFPYDDLPWIIRWTIVAGLSIILSYAVQKILPERVIRYLGF